MSSTAELQRREGSSWVRGFVPVAQREVRRWLGTRRGLIQLFLWSGLLGGVLAVALFVLPNSMTDEGPLSLAETLEVGRQLFFGIGAIVPVEVIVQFTPWKFSDLAIISASGLPLPDVGVTMLVSTIAWIAVFMAVAIIRLGRAPTVRTPRHPSRTRT